MGWAPEECAKLPEVEGLEDSGLILQACRFHPGRLEAPLDDVLLLVARLLRQPSGKRAPRNSLRPSRRAAPRTFSGVAPCAEGVQSPTSSPSRRSLDKRQRYRDLETAGKGAFGIVSLAEAPDGKRVAVKRVQPDAGRESREADLLRRIRHPCVVSLLEAFETEGKNNKRQTNLVMEYMPETLHIRVGGKPLPISEVRCFSFQLLRSLAHLDGMRICHRDVKPENVLLRGRVLKLADFGSAKVLDGGASSSYICSRWWRAPELVLGAAEYVTSVDWWSCGCVVGEMMLGEPLFQGDSSWGQMYAITRVLGTPNALQVRALRPARGDGRLAAHLGKLAELERPARPWADLLPAFARCPEALELPSRLLAYDPTARWHPTEALLGDFLVGLPDDVLPLPPCIFEFTNEELKAARRPQELAKFASKRRKERLHQRPSIPTPMRLLGRRPAAQRPMQDGVSPQPKRQRRPASPEEL